MQDARRAGSLSGPKSGLRSSRLRICVSDIGIDMGGVDTVIRLSVSGALGAGPGTRIKAVVPTPIAASAAHRPITATITRRGRNDGRAECAATAALRGRSDSADFSAAAILAVTAGGGAGAAGASGPAGGT